MARRQLIRRMIGSSLSRAEDALAWAVSHALDALVLMDVLRADGPRWVRQVVRHPLRSARTVVEARPAARRRAPVESRPVEPRPAVPAKVAPAPPQHLPEPTDPEFRLDSGHARVTTTSRGRKTVPIAVAAARKARAQLEPKPGLRPKHGQKKH